MEDEETQSIAKLGLFDKKTSLHSRALMKEAGSYSYESCGVELSYAASARFLSPLFQKGSSDLPAILLSAAFAKSIRRTGGGVGCSRVGKENM
jgi:hypothetical protein